MTAGALTPTLLIDSDHPAVVAFARHIQNCRHPVKTYGSDMLATAYSSSMV
jgi:hypothetical protein